MLKGLKYRWDTKTVLQSHSSSVRDL
ncbi:unnamed protein product [Cuscuta epithymum]|uniref:Uncharacterized protein n=1 Tax=Cuscuta epithymum TaxID=186058 RepID=A0AAV0ED64_9ASTE|nr:unnamed protein product [Cuscuta epithymum]